MTNIPRYIDDPPEFAFWTVDELALFSIFMGLGIVTNTLTYLILVGLLASFVFKKIKTSRSDGFFHHVLYWVGFMPLKGCPPSYIREYIE